MVAAFVVAQPSDDVGGTTVGTHPVGVSARAFQQEADLRAACTDSLGRLLRGRGLSRIVGIGGASITFSSG